jgi:hypothetical protein
VDHGELAGFASPFLPLRGVFGAIFAGAWTTDDDLRESGRPEGAHGHRIANWQREGSQAWRGDMPGWSSIDEAQHRQMFVCVRESGLG